MLDSFYSYFLLPLDWEIFDTKNKFLLRLHGFLDLTVSPINSIAQSIAELG